VKRQIFFNYYTEITFTILALSPDQQSLIINESKYASEVLITWAEQFVENIEYYSVKMHGFVVQIVIFPLPSGLFHIKIYKKEPIPPFGPLLDDMVVSKELLAPMVRQTAVNAALGVKQREGSLRQPYAYRQKLIQEFINKNKLRHTPDEWWATQFLEK